MQKGFILSLILLILSGIAMGQVPQLINYQGLLIDPATGQPVPDDTYSIAFSIYDAASSGSAIWTETQSVTTKDGLYSVLLGSTTTLTTAILSGPDKYLGIKVGGVDPEILPRKRIVSVAYAIRAEDTDKLLGYGLSPTPQPEKLLPLDNDGKFPASVFPAGIYLKKNESDASIAASADPLLLISNTGNGNGIDGRANQGIGVSARSENNDGVVGWTGSSSNSGVFGHSTAGKGVTGRSDLDDGVVGWSGASDKSGVFGHSTNGAGVTGSSENNSGVVARSDNSHGLSIPYAKANGIDVVQADANGVKVYQSNESAIYVQTAGHDGVRVIHANWSGVYVQNAGYDAIRVQNAGQDGLRIFDGVGRDYFRAGSDANPEFRFNKGGDAYADSGWFSGADFAELIEVENNASNYEPGDVLVISSDKNRAVTLSSEPYSTAIIGVYSTKPGFVGTTHPMQGKYDNEIPVAITGIVPCKVTTENGQIKRGDLLTTSSTPGYAMKATAPKIGTVLGRALESLETGRGKIEALIILQ